MSKWTRVKAAVLAVAVVGAITFSGGCLNLSTSRILQLVAIGSIFD